MLGILLSFFLAMVVSFLVLVIYRHFNQYDDFDHITSIIATFSLVTSFVIFVIIGIFTIWKSATKSVEYEEHLINYERIIEKTNNNILISAQDYNGIINSIMTWNTDAKKKAVEASKWYNAATIDKRFKEPLLIDYSDLLKQKEIIMANSVIKVVE